MLQSHGIPPDNTPEENAAEPISFQSDHFVCVQWPRLGSDPTRPQLQYYTTRTTPIFPDFGARRHKLARWGRCQTGSQAPRQ